MHPALPNIAMNVESNSPLKKPPADYCPAGSEHWFEIPQGLDAGKKLFYYDFSTAPEQDVKSTVLFVHGNPESSYTYRHIRDALVQSQQPLRIVAMDHIGLGLSDQADFEMVDMHHARHVLQLVQHLDLQNITLVVHDWGGPIGVGALLQEPQRVQALAVMNSTVFPMPQQGLTYRNYPFAWLPWCRVPSLVPDALWGGLAAAVVCHAHPQGTAEFLSNVGQWTLRYAAKRIEPDSPEYVFSQMLRSGPNARSSKRNVRQTPVWGHGYRYKDKKHGLQDNHAFYRLMQQNLAKNWGPQGQNIPVCAYFGQWDPCGKNTVIEQWCDALPQMKNQLYRFADIGHFVEEYKGPEIAASIVKMLPA